LNQKIDGKTLYRGFGVNVLRTVMLNVSLTIPYNYLNECFWKAFGDVSFNKPFALLGASLVSTIFTLPIDAIRTRYLKMYANEKLNRINYSNAFDVARVVMLYESKKYI